MNVLFGGSVERKEQREDGQQTITVDTSSALFGGLQPMERVLMTHGDSVGVLAPCFKAIGHSSNNIIAGTPAPNALTRNTSSPVTRSLFCML